MVGRRVLALLMVVWATGASGRALGGAPTWKVTVDTAAEPPVVDVGDLISNPTQYDGRPVAIAGEVIGEVAVIGPEKQVWVQSGLLAVTVWAPAEVMRPIRHAGRKYVTGDTVRVSGVFHSTDGAHGGEPAILATRMALVSEGGKLRPEYEQVRTLLTAVAWFVGGVAIGAWHLWKRRSDAR